ncbi:MAG: FAD binding domain-containing protein [Deltaproteobacteria bacterium]|jgi:CO/xanthine dehydrogenase FAD-binding subunit|nr:FAD binding domain-containing protein [Deltaproteobacteria bacterium]MBW2469430.1 FAD binding domain-containing protein [Deltaproteobacteria bacterium]MBW2486212.1 FAD binding domain-containing protein [Deltaproteobacteria bacterium]
MFDVDYIKATNLEDALDFLNTNGAETKILAGGTDILVDMRSGALKPRFLLDVSRLDDLKKIEIQDGQLCIGAAVTISELLESDTIAAMAPALRKAAEKFASRQIRNVATIGGNVAHCSPCGDTIPPLLIHDASAVVLTSAGRRHVTIEEMASGPYHCSLHSDEIISHFVLQPRPREVTFVDFQKIGRRQELAIARMSMAAMACQDERGSIAYMRFALGSCTPTPHRFREVEEYMTGKVPAEHIIWEAGRLVADKMLSITGRRPSAVYKEPAIQGLFVRMMRPLVANK